MTYDFEAEARRRLNEVLSERGIGAADRIEALEAENERLTARVAELEAVLKRCAEIVRLHNHRQNEKVDDVIYLARAALQETSHD